MNVYNSPATPTFRSSYAAATAASSPLCLDCNESSRGYPECSSVPHGDSTRVLNFMNDDEVTPGYVASGSATQVKCSIHTMVNMSHAFLARRRRRACPCQGPYCDTIGGKSRTSQRVKGAQTAAFSGVSLFWSMGPSSSLFQRSCWLR